MRISKVLELLLILIIIAFAASKPYRRKRVTNLANGDKEDDEDDFFGLGVGNLDEDEKLSNSSQSLDSLDEGDSFLLFGDDFLTVFDDYETDSKEPKKFKNKLHLSAVASTQGTSQKFVTRQPIHFGSNNSQLIPIETVQTVVNQLTQNHETLSEKEKASNSKLNFQHTSALLQLVQNSNNIINQNLTQNNILKLEPNNFSNYHTPNEILLSQSDHINEQIMLDTQNQEISQSSNYVAQDSYHSTTATPIKKKTTHQQPNSGILGIVEDLIEDDDEDENQEEDGNDDEENEDDDYDDEDIPNTHISSQIPKKTVDKVKSTKAPKNLLEAFSQTFAF